MSVASKHFHQFGVFTVDSDQKVLLRNGVPLRLAPKVFDTLLILLENGGRIVEKEELMSRLWPDTFVEEGINFGLAACEFYKWMRIYKRGCE
jgi:DNA-binding winged helix-turn-helix (wHTH) protein